MKKPSSILCLFFPSAPVVIVSELHVWIALNKGGSDFSDTFDSRASRNIVKDNNEWF